MPEIWHMANSAFAVPVAVVGASPWATLGEYFAVCLGHTAKYRNPVVQVMKVLVLWATSQVMHELFLC